MASSRHAVLVGLAALALGAAGCKRQKIPVATQVWLGPAGGCAVTKEHPLVGTFACWGDTFTGPAKEWGGAFTLPGGPLTGISLGAHHACASLGGKPYCWGDGAHGELGPTTKRSATPVLVGDPAASGEQAVAAGGAHTCVRSPAGDALRCFGADDAGQLGIEGGKAVWDQGREIKTVVLGAAQTCAAYATAQGGGEPFTLCRGRSMPKEPILPGRTVLQLAVGEDHACALVENRTVHCWGKNDAGQLGDGTTNASAVPVQVEGLQAFSIAAGAHHTCALLPNRTVACWGRNDRHQLANGTTKPSSRPSVLVGLVQVRALAAGGDDACAIVDDGLVRCWGPNDKHELGDGTTDEHTVPMPVKYR